MMVSIDFARLYNYN